MSKITHSEGNGGASMSSGNVHYEVFQRRGKASGWTLFGALASREAAINEAKALLARGEAAGVRVLKETFKAETGDFQSLKVFEEGDIADVKAKVQEGTSLPCFKPDDFYSFHGRRSIARLLSEALGRWRITATELLHHAGHIERLELTGTVMQHAVQKAAIKHAGATGEPVQQIVKQLNELISRAIQRVVLDERNNRLPRIGKEGFGSLCARFADVSGADYYVNCAIARHIEDAKGWSEKLAAVIALLNDLPADGPAREVGLRVVDSLVAELLEGNAAITDLLGETPNLGHALLKLADLFLGRNSGESGANQGLCALSSEFSKGNLVSARAAIGQRVLDEIKGVRRLDPGSLDEEVRLMRLLATRMAMGQGKLASQDEILDAFNARSRQLVMSEPMERYLAGVHSPDARIEKLYALEENVIGIANKRQLSGFILAIIGSPRTEVYFTDSASPPLQRLQTLSAIYDRNRKAGFQEIERRQIADRIDQIAVMVEQKSGLIEATIRSTPDPWQAVHKLLGLVSNGLLPEGSVSEVARRRAREIIARPSFRAQLGAADPAKLSAFQKLLASAGLETSPGKENAA